ncbi:MAG: hypothetical protein Q4G19_02560 [Clostridia bacterium]|nr:hypothetical protein [Clostridia bacterium]
MTEETKGKYADIIDTDYRGSPTRPHMSAHDRAGQFAPFAALSGYGAMIREAENGMNSDAAEAGTDEWEDVYE